MATNQVKLIIENENHKSSDKHFDDEIEMIFGKPAPALPKNHVTNNVHLIDNERGHDTHVNGNNNNFAESDLERPNQPLLEPSRERQVPPLAGPEIDDLDGDPPKDATPYPGIDDGFLDTTNEKPERDDHENGDHPLELEPNDKHSETNDGHHSTDGNLPWAHDEPDYPYGSEAESETPIKRALSAPLEASGASHSYISDPNHSDVNGLATRFGDSRPVSPIPGMIPDVNTYQQKKNLAQGMMDLALLSANANQLRYVLEMSSAKYPYYYFALVFISLSIILQTLVGVGLIMNSRYDVNNHKERCKADKINNMTVLGVFLITIVNVFITSFSVTQAPIENTPQQAG